MAQARRPATITVSAVGDMIFDRNVKALIASQGGGAPLAKVASRLKRADVTVGNLESNLSRSGSPMPGKDVTFRGDPRGIVGLKASGFDFVALGNNHVLDYGSTSLRDTLAALDRAGIRHAGAGMNRTAAWKPAVVTRDGATIAFLSFSHILPAGFVATSSHAGLAAGRGNMNAVASAIKAAQKRYDYVIVSFHWGIEYKDYANADQVRDARRAVDAGADMVLSHHPHVIQGVEFYKGKLIAYSLGDFVFDHYSRKTGEAFILDAKLGPSGIRDVDRDSGLPQRERHARGGDRQRGVDDPEAPSADLGAAQDEGAHHRFRGEAQPMSTREPSFARPPRDTGLMLEGRAARERRRRRRGRQRALLVAALVLSGLVAAGWLLSHTTPKPPTTHRDRIGVARHAARGGQDRSCRRTPAGPDPALRRVPRCCAARARAHDRAHRDRVPPGFVHLRATPRDETSHLPDRQGEGQTGHWPQCGEQRDRLDTDGSAATCSGCGAPARASPTRRPTSEPRPARPSSRR